MHVFIWKIAACTWFATDKLYHGQSKPFYSDNRDDFIVKVLTLRCDARKLRNAVAALSAVPDFRYVVRNLRRICMLTFWAFASTIRKINENVRLKKRYPKGTWVYVARSTFWPMLSGGSIRFKDYRELRKLQTKTKKKKTTKNKEERKKKTSDDEKLPGQTFTSVLFWISSLVAHWG